MQTVTVSATPASAHARRVTLNILRHAECCPTDLRPVLNRLASLDWDLEALTREEGELIYAHVDDEITEQAKAEYVADTSTIVDHRKSDATCKLCGHKHIRWEFQLRNIAGGQDHWTGSTCIETYGIAVDGEGTADAALAKLRAAISSAKRKAEREDWQEAYPAHVGDLAYLADARANWEARLSGHLWRFMRPQWKRRAHEHAKLARAILRYYHRHGFLTAKRTEQLYGSAQGIGMLAIARRELRELKNAQDAYTARRDYWQGLVNEYGPRLTYGHRSALQSAAQGTVTEAEIEAAREGGTRAPWRARDAVRALAAIEELEDAPAPAPVDNSDLPF